MPKPKAQALQTVSGVLASPGVPLETAAREQAESALGQDFRTVRIHADERAADAADALDARAFASGPHIVFGRGEYAPHTTAGRDLLSHELTHVLQQRAGVATGGLADERAADRHTPPVAVTAGRAPVPTGAVIQRQPKSPAAPAPTQGTGALAQELQDLIAAGTWEEIRKRIYPGHAQSGIARAKQRKAGAAPDLTGLGSIKTLEHFARAVRALAGRWSKLDPDGRTAALGDAIGDEMVTVNVPRFQEVNKAPIASRGRFDHGDRDWTLNLSEELMSRPSLGDEDIADVASAVMHEARHAEQVFLRARLAAGTGLDAEKIAAQHHIPSDIAARAVTLKFTAATPTPVRRLGEQMQAQEDDPKGDEPTLDFVKAVDDLDERRKMAKTALAKLRTTADTATINDARLAANLLRSQITTVEQKFAPYHAVPNEQDAYEVTDAETEAVKGWK